LCKHLVLQTISNSHFGQRNSCLINLPDPRDSSTAIDALFLVGMATRLQELLYSIIFIHLLSVMMDKLNEFILCTMTFISSQSPCSKSRVHIFAPKSHPCWPFCRYIQRHAKICSETETECCTRPSMQLNQNPPHRDHDQTSSGVCSPESP
jgi:hypothetical protein